MIKLSGSAHSTLLPSECKINSAPLVVQITVAGGQRAGVDPVRTASGSEPVRTAAALSELCQNHPVVCFPIDTGSLPLAVLTGSTRALVATIFTLTRISAHCFEK